MRKLTELKMHGPVRQNPPRRTAFIRPGTVVEHEGKRWIMTVGYAGFGESYKSWKDYDSYLSKLKYLDEIAQREARPDVSKLFRRKR